MYHKFIFFAIWLSLICVSRAVLPEDPIEYQRWEEKILLSIARQEQEPRDEALERLGKWLRQLNPNDTINTERGDALVFKSTQAMALSLPGHAEYFGKKVTDPYEQIKQGYAEGKRASELPWSRYLRNSWDAFKVLSLLPSHETVYVLGEMLEDDWKWPGYEQEIHADYVRDTLDIRALGALSKLPFVNPPTGPLHTPQDWRDNVGVWKVWYQEIKDGRRTFRFIGDSVHYDLRGPSKRGEVFPNTSRSGKRADTSGETGASQSPERQTSRFLPYLLGFLFVAAGLVYYFKRRAANA